MPDQNPSTKTTSAAREAKTKVSATEHGSANLSAQWQNELSGRGSARRIGMSNATERAKQKKSEHHRAWECPLSAQLQNEQLGRRGVEKGEN